MEGVASQGGRSGRHQLVRLLVLFAVAASILYTTAVALTPLTRYQWLSLSRGMSEADEAELQADAGIVLGYSLLSDGTVSPVLADRLRKGAGLLRAGKVRVLILSGGRQNRTVQAQAMADWLQQEEGMNKDLLVQERWSNNTEQNARLSLEIVRQHGWKRIVVVTSSFHQLRSSLVFQELEDQEGSAEVVLMARHYEEEQVARWEGEWDFIRECGAILKYILNGYVPLLPTVRLLLPMALPYLAVASVLFIILSAWVFGPKPANALASVIEKRNGSKANSTNKEKRA